MRLSAVVAQLVERKLPKLEVASSNLVRRFRFAGTNVARRHGFGGVESRAPCGQARASAGKKVTNLLPPCCHGIRLPQTTGAQLAMAVDSPRTPRRADRSAGSLPRLRSGCRVGLRAVQGLAGRSGWRWIPEGSARGGSADKSAGGEGLRSPMGGPWTQSEPRVRRSGS